MWYYLDTYTSNQEAAVDGKDISFPFVHVWYIVEFVLLEIRKANIQSIIKESLRILDIMGKI